MSSRTPAVELDPLKTKASITMGWAFFQTVHRVAARGSEMVKNVEPRLCAVGRQANTLVAGCLGDFQPAQELVQKPDGIYCMRDCTQIGELHANW